MKNTKNNRIKYLFCKAQINTDDGILGTIRYNNTKSCWKIVSDEDFLETVIQMDFWQAGNQKIKFSGEQHRYPNFP